MFHYPGLAHPGGAETPEMTFAVIVMKTQFQNGVGMIKVNAGADMGPWLFLFAFEHHVPGNDLTNFTCIRSFNSRSTAIMAALGSGFVARTMLLWPT